MHKGTYTQGKRLCEEGEPSRGTLGIAGSQVKLEEARKGSFQSLPREYGPATTLILDFSPPELWNSKFLLFWATQFVVLCYSNARKQIQPVTNMFGSSFYISHDYVSPFLNSLWGPFAPSLSKEVHTMRVFLGLILFRRNWLSRKKE